MGIVAAFEELEDQVDESEDLEIETFNDFQEELILANETIQNQIKVIDTALLAYNDYASGRFTAEQVKYAVFAAESAVYGEVMSNSAIFASENMLTEAGKAIGNLISNMHQGLLKFIDYSQYAIKLFNVQESRIRRIKNKLSYASSGTAIIRTGSNKYLCYGVDEKPVSDFKEYRQQYALLGSVLEPFLEATSDLTKDDLFSGLKWLKEAVFGDLEEFFDDRFTSLERTVGGLASKIKAHQTKSTGLYREFESPVLLGLAVIHARIPQPSIYKRHDFESTLEAHKYFYMCAKRRMKVRLSTLIDGSITMEVDKRGLLELMETSEKMIKYVNALSSFTSRLSVGGAFSAASDSFVNRRSATEEYDPQSFYKTMKIYNRISSIIYDSATTGFTLALGNIKQACKIAESGLKKLS